MHVLLTNELWLRIHCVKVRSVLSLIQKQFFFHQVLIGYGANWILDWTIIIIIIKLTEGRLRDMGTKCSMAL